MEILVILGAVVVMVTIIALICLILKDLKEEIEIEKRNAELLKMWLEKAKKEREKEE